MYSRVSMLDILKIKAITFDLDDTLWPVWPVIERAEVALLQWLSSHAPKTARIFQEASNRQNLRNQVLARRPELGHDLSEIRLAMIELALRQSNEPILLAQKAFDVFFNSRNQVDLFDDVIESLDFLSKRFPLVAISNGNAEINKVGLSKFFQHALNPKNVGFAKPDARIFMAAANVLEIQPNAILHVGDDPNLDVIAGLNVGMQTAWVNRQGDPWTLDVKPQLEVQNLIELCVTFKSIRC